MLDKRLKRFKPRQGRELTIALEIDSNSIQGIIVDISLASVGFVTPMKADPLTLDKIGSGLVVCSSETHDIGKVVVVRVSEIDFPDTNEDFALVVVRAFERHLPLEHLMRFLDNEDGSSPYSFELTHGRYTMADFYKYEGSDDIIEKTRFFASMSSSWRRKNAYQFERYRSESSGKRVTLDRPRPDGDSEYLVFCSNDYLGLASHEKVIKSTKEV